MKLRYQSHLLAKPLHIAGRSREFLRQSARYNIDRPSLFWICNDIMNVMTGEIKNRVYMIRSTTIVHMIQQQLVNQFPR